MFSRSGMVSPSRCFLCILWIIILLEPVVALSDGSDSTVRAEADTPKQHENHPKRPCKDTHNHRPRRKLGIAGGKPSRLGRDPWMVALLDKWRKHLGPFCGGSLIARRYVLTAAHCLGKDPLSMEIKEATTCARLGDFNWKVDETPIHQDRDIERVIRHETYLNTSELHDIALIIVVGDVFLDINIQIIPMAEDDDGLVNRTARATGWGWLGMAENHRQPSRLREVDLKVVQLPYTGEEQMGVPNALIAGDIPGYSTHYGDSGGPLSIMINKSRRLIGVAIAGLPQIERFPKFIRVVYYADWIADKMNESMID